MKDLKGLVNRFIRENLVIRKKSKKSERNIQRLPFFVTSCRRVRHKLPRRGKRRPAGGRTIKEAAAAGPPLPALLYGAASCAGFSSMVPLSWAESEWIGYKQKEKFYQYDTKTLTERPWSFLSLYSIINIQRCATLSPRCLAEGDICKDWAISGRLTYFCWRAYAKPYAIG